MATAAGPVSPGIVKSFSTGLHSNGHYPVRGQHTTSKSSEQVAYSIDEINRQLFDHLQTLSVIDKKSLKEAAKKWSAATKIVIETTETNKIKLPSNLLSKLVKYFPGIEVLKLRNYQQASSGFFFSVNDEDFVAAIPKLGSLRVIKLNSCPYLTEESYTALFQTCTQLQKADIDSNHLTNEHLRAALNLKTLTRLEFGGENSIDDAGLTILSEEGDHLTHLGLNSYQDETRSPFSLTAAKAFVATLPHLLSLRLHGCERLDDAFLQTLAAKHEPLQHLSLKPAFQASKETLSALPNLKSLAIGDTYASLRSQNS